MIKLVCGSILIAYFTFIAYNLYAEEKPTTHVKCIAYQGEAYCRDVK